MTKLIAMPLAVLMIALIAFTGCQMNAEVEARPAAPTKPPVLIGVLFDVSGSVSEHGDIDQASLEKLLKIVGLRGGTIGLGLITDKSFRPLLVGNFHLYQEPMRGNLKEQGEINIRNKRRLTTFKQEMTAYLQEAMTLLGTPRDVQKSDVARALERFSVLFNQPNFGGYEKHMILCTDGKDNVTKSFSFVPRAMYYTVGWRVDAAKKIFGENVIQFEAFPGLVDYLGTVLIDTAQPVDIGA